jgi:hypothetical protein
LRAKLFLRNKEDLDFLTKKTSFINENITKFSFKNIEMADIFLKKTSEIISLTTVLYDKKFVLKTNVYNQFDKITVKSNNKKKGKIKTK